MFPISSHIDAVEAARREWRGLILAILAACCIAAASLAFAADLPITG
jgi:hypothetical protein